MDQLVLNSPFENFLASNGLAKLCHDSWGPFDHEFHLTSCFIDGVLYGAIHGFLLLFGSHQIYSLSSTSPMLTRVDWQFWLKIVCSFT